MAVITLAHLPDDWTTTRRRVLTRDGHRCVATTDDGARCAKPAVVVDVIDASDDHAMPNLQSLCLACQATRDSAARRSS